mmetsp:Transcript_51937/g.105765  ORF Transcript_51937/g.105765 Transcript_51937/m.105765 type:complete len:193 (-) Transcript_51937:311-889(-)
MTDILQRGLHRVGLMCSYFDIQREMRGIERLFQAKPLLSSGCNIPTDTLLRELPTSGIVGLYFCESKRKDHSERIWERQLVEYYQKKRRDGANDFQIVFVSCDSTEPEFWHDFAQQPWLAVPFDEKHLRESLVQKYYAPTFAQKGQTKLVLFDASSASLVVDHECAQPSFEEKRHRHRHHHHHHGHSPSRAA